MGKLWNLRTPAKKMRKQYKKIDRNSEYLGQNFMEIYKQQV